MAQELSFKKETIYCIRLIQINKKSSFNANKM